MTATSPMLARIAEQCRKNTEKALVKCGLCDKGLTNPDRNQFYLQGQGYTRICDGCWDERARQQTAEALRFSAARERK